MGLQRLDRLQQRDQFVDTLKVGAGRFGVFANPVTQPGSHLQGALRQAVLQRGVQLAAKVQGCRHQVKRAARDWAGRCRHGAHAVSTRTPAAASIRQVRISGSPTRAVGSSLSMRSSRAMPKPSLLALPAQSYGVSASR